MNTLNPLAAQPAGIRPLLNPHRPSFSKSLSFRISTPAPYRFSLHAVKASSQNPNPKPLNKPNNLFLPQLTDEISKSIPLKSTLVATIAAAAFFLTGFRLSLKPSFATPIPPPPTVETAAEIQPHSNSDEIDELKSSIEIKINSRKIPEAIEVLNKLILLEPDEIEWRLLRGHLYALNSEYQSAREVFHGMLNENPSSFEACQGLVNVDSQEESTEELKRTEERISEAIRLAGGNDSLESRGLRLLLAQIRVLDGKLEEALELYKELEKEEPEDFKVYLCEGLVYGMLKRKDEAEISLEKYKRLAPEGHLHHTFIDDDILNAAKVFSEKSENENEGKV